MELTNNKELRRLLERAQHRGWRFEKRRKHIFGKHADGTRTTTISQTPSDYSALKNIAKHLGVPL